jgi:hypothetical protein
MAGSTCTVTLGRPAYRGQVTQLPGHDLRRPDAPVQGHVIDNAGDRRRIIAEQHAALTLHP